MDLIKRTSLCMEKLPSDVWDWLSRAVLTKSCTVHCPMLNVEATCWSFLRIYAIMPLQAAIPPNSDMQGCGWYLEWNKLETSATHKINFRTEPRNSTHFLAQKGRNFLLQMTGVWDSWPSLTIPSIGFDRGLGALLVEKFLKAHGALYEQKAHCLGGKS